MALTPPTSTRNSGSGVPPEPDKPGGCGFLGAFVSSCGLIGLANAEDPYASALSVVLTVAGSLLLLSGIGLRVGFPYSWLTSLGLCLFVWLCSSVLLVSQVAAVWVTALSGDLMIATHSGMVCAAALFFVVTLWRSRRSFGQRAREQRQRRVDEAERR